MAAHKHEYSLFVRRHLEFLPSLASHNRGNRSAEFLNLELMGIVVGITYACSYVAYKQIHCKYIYSLFVSHHRGFPTFVASQSTGKGNCFIEFIDPGNINIAVGIVQLSCSLVIPGPPPTSPTPAPSNSNSSVTVA